MGCNCGFGGGGGGGGGGNLSGTLTNPRVPYASAANTLADSSLYYFGATEMQYIVDGPGNWAWVSNGGPDAIAVQWITARGTAEVPAALHSGDDLANLEGYGYDGGAQRIGASLKAVADGAPIAG